MHLRTKLTIFILLFSSFVFSQNAPKYSNEFFSIGVGARALAMGNSVIASTNDITSLYWNPSGLVNLDYQFEVGAMHSEYFAGLSKFDFLGASYKLDESSALGLSMIRFGVDDIPNTLNLIDEEGNIRYDRISSFSVADYAFLMTYSRKSSIEGLNYGANMKIIRRIAGEFGGSWGFGFDLGAQYAYKNWFFGAQARDITSSFNAWTYNTETFQEVFEQTGNQIPENGLEITLPRLLIGAGYLFELPKSFTIYPELGMDFTFDGKRNTPIRTSVMSIDPHLGIEIGYNNLVFLRGGFSNFQPIPDFDDKTNISWQPNIGLGINFKGLRIDYALTDIGNQSIALYSHVFSLSYRFNAIKSKSSF
ncbi:MAG: PorV/PorQ family protein [Bacteroidales bacterium]|nr:PorV/PorQ family protein [Bacteroidales bacterium]